MLGAGKSPFGDLGCRADAKDIDAIQPLDQLLLAQGARKDLDLVAGRSKEIARATVDVLQKQSARSRHDAKPRPERTLAATRPRNSESVQASGARRGRRETRG